MRKLDVSATQGAADHEVRESGDDVQGPGKEDAVVAGVARPPEHGIDEGESEVSGLRDGAGHTGATVGRFGWVE